MENCIYWLPFLFIIIILLEQQRKRKIAIIKHILNNKKHSKENKAMKELAKQFIGKECIIYTVTSSDSTIKGTIKEVSDGGIIVEDKDGAQAVNLEFITRIREWPRNAKGKKKQVIV